MSLSHSDWTLTLPRQRSAVLLPAGALALAGLVIGALALRFGGLDTVPLSPGESDRALQAYEIYRGRGGDYASGPLLLNLQAIWFWLFTPADGPARAPAALAGLALVLSLWLYRPWLGRAGAVLAAALLAISPLGVLASRSADPAVFVLLAASVGVGCVLRAYAGGDGRWLLGAAVALALGLGASWAAVGQVMAVALAAAIVPPLDRAQPVAPRTWAPRAVGIGLLVAVLADSLLLTRPGGVQAGLIEPITAWLGALGLSRASLLAGAQTPLYEATLLGLAAWTLPLTLRDRFGRFLVAWALSTFVLGLLYRLPDLGSLAAPTLPLALLVGRGLTRFTWVSRGASPRIWLTGLALVVPVVFLVFSMNASFGRGNLPTFSALAVAVGGLVAIVLLVSAWLDTTELLAAVGVGVGILLLALHLSALTRLNYAGFERGGPLLLAQSSRPQLMEVELRARDWWRQDPTRPVQVDESLRPLLAWSLRDGPPIEWVRTAPPTPDRAILGGETAADRPQGEWLRLAVAERYTPREDPVGLADLWRWLILRQAIVRSEAYAILLPS